MRTFVLDASAAVEYVQKGQGTAKVEQLLTDALRQHLRLLISVVNLAELFYLAWQRVGEEKARQTVTNFSRLPVQIVGVDLSQALKAGELKAVHKIPYVDCIAAALAVQQSATLVTSDRDFEKMGRHFPVLWLTRP
ncbi:MAG TPA: type II toxin-antitoxin system VapC family toxin [Candidatus Sulfotelmatobacter sp.]|nr:type II toxin-antitoxin system VapC family toxin [Candidatus Sulfotelmatobacter sp.]